MSPTRISLSFAGLPTPYRRGIERAAVEADVLSDDGVTIALAPLERTAESCAQAEHLAANNDRIVCLLEPLDVAGIAHAIAHGAYFAAFDAEPEQVLRAVVAATESSVEIPFEVAAAMIEADSHGSLDLTDEESAWLVALGGGTTVVKLADDFGYSERVLFRRLHELYSRLGVSNRAEALVAVERRKLLRRPERSN